MTNRSIKEKLLFSGRKFLISIKRNYYIIPLIFVFITCFQFMCSLYILSTKTNCSNIPVLNNPLSENSMVILTVPGKHPYSFAPISLKDGIYIFTLLSVIDVSILW